MPEHPESEAIEAGPEVPPPSADEPPEPTDEPSKYHFLKWSTFLLVLVAVWLPAAAIGVGLYYWWFHTLGNKTMPMFVVLLFVIGCTVAALLLAMAGQRPLIAALAIAVITAPYAATLGAAPVHGSYYCEKSITPVRCLFGLLPY